MEIIYEQKEAVKRKPKNEIQKIIFNRLLSAMDEFKSGLKTKKLESNLKNISKQFAAEFVKAVAKKNTNVKKTKNKTGNQEPELQSNNQPAV